MRRPLVFLSSVFRAMEGVRQRVHDELEALGYAVWRAEDHPALQHASPEEVRSVCLAGVESSDAYLGVLPSRYGSDPLGLAFTELEYHQALRSGLPRRVYLLPDKRFHTVDQVAKQRGFLLLVRDRELTSIPAQHVGSIADLIERIKTDFSTPLSASPRYELGSAPCVASIHDFARTGTLIDRAPHVPLHAAASFLEESAATSLSDARTLGLLLLQLHLQDPRWDEPSYLRHIDALLSMWCYVSAWGGVAGVLSQTRIAKARIVISQMAGHEDRIPELAALVASGYYSDRRLEAAERWYELARRPRRVPWLEGAIHLARNRMEAAKECFLDVLRQPATSNNTHALHLGYYGLCLVRQDQERNGLRHLDEAVGMSNIEDHARTRIYRALAEAHLHLGGHSEAEVMCDLAENAARDKGLDSQMRKSAALRRKIRRASGVT